MTDRGDGMAQVRALVEQLRHPTASPELDVELRAWVRSAIDCEMAPDGLEASDALVEQFAQIIEAHVAAMLRPYADELEAALSALQRIEKTDDTQIDGTS